MTRRALLLLLAAVLCGCRPRGPRLDLAPGESVEMLAMHRVAMPDGRTILAVHYRTSLPLEDRAAVERQADAVRTNLADTIAHAKATRVVVQAHSMHLRWLRTVDRSLRFAFEPVGKGGWQQAAEGPVRP